MPWSAIIANAPLVVDSAKKLAALVRSKPPVTAAGTSPLTRRQTDRVLADLAVLQARIRQLEEEQRQASELLRSLAENNAQMVQALDYLRAVRTNGRIAALALAVALFCWEAGCYSADLLGAPGTGSARPLQAALPPTKETPAAAGNDKGALDSTSSSHHRSQPASNRRLAHLPADRTKGRRRSPDCREQSPCPG